MSTNAPTPNVDHDSAVDPIRIEIRAFAPGGDATTFRTLNEEWITRHFTLEAKDREVLGDPENSVLRLGGRIFVVEADATLVGCVAITPMTDGVYELSKMAVAPQMRGQGIGRRLLRHAVAEARALGARRLFLASSTRLPAAVHLYESVGFHHVPRHSLPDLPYTRPDVFMALEL